MAIDQAEAGGIAKPRHCSLSISLPKCDRRLAVRGTNLKTPRSQTEGYAPQMPRNRRLSVLGMYLSLTGMALRLTGVWLGSIGSKLTLVVPVALTVAAAVATAIAWRKGLFSTSRG